MASNPPEPAREPRDASLNLHQRMLLVTERIGYIPKEGTGPESQGSYKFARVEHIKDRVRDELVAVGVMVHASFEGRDVKLIQGTDRNGNPRTTILATVWGTMTFVNVDDPDDRHTVSIHGQGVDTQDKAVSKATTSADKYGLLNAFQIPTGVDPDEVGEDIPTQQAQAQQPRQDRPQQGGQGGGDPRDEGWYQQQPPAQQQRQYPSGEPGPGGKCPKHGRPWKSGQYGWFCSAKDPDGKKGYCEQRPSKEWVAANER